MRRVLRAGRGVLAQDLDVLARRDVGLFREPLRAVLVEVEVGDVDLDARALQVGQLAELTKALAS